MDQLNDLWWTYEGLILDIGINGLLALSVYLVLATGQLFLAQGAFMAVGAYGSAVMALDFGAPFAVAVLSGAALAGLMALVISWPMLRLSGVYLGIGTIAFGEVIRAVVVNTDALGGALGLTGIPEGGGAGVIYGVLAVVILLCFMVLRSRVGRAMEAVRTDETAAQVLGVHAPRLKLAVILASAMLAGLAGAFHAYAQSSISPSEFNFEASVGILSFAILGGTKSPAGAIAGAIILTVLPELLRPIGDFRTMMNGLIIMMVVAFRPAGLIPWRVTRIGRHA
jgi:branched-chain amino acid transport system permease protein